MTQPYRARTARSPLDHNPDELRHRRVMTPLTLKELAARVGEIRRARGQDGNVSWSYLSELERGHRNPSRRLLLDLATALGCTAEDLAAPVAVSAEAS